jgi:hypothetical protein
MQHQAAEAPQLKRRHLLAGGLGALVAGALTLPSKAKALSGDFVFGGRNLIASRTVVELQTAGEAAFEASNPAGGIGLLGTSGINDVSNPMNIKAGLWAAGQNGAYGGWVQSQGKPGLLAISDQIGSLAIQGTYSDAPQSDFIKAAAWNYSKAHFGTWNQSLNGIGSLSMSDSSIGALNVAGAYGDVPQADYIKAGSWNYSKVYVGGWNASEESFGSLSMSHKAIGALNVSGMYSDLPQSDFLKAGSWNYSKGFYGAWNQSQDGVGSLSMSETSIGSISTSGAVYSAAQLGQLDPAGFHAAAAGAVPGTCSVSQRGPGVIAMSASGVGLIATSGNPYSEAQLAGVDAAGLHSAASGEIPAACFAAQMAPGGIGMSMSHIGLIGTTGDVYTEESLLKLDAAGIHAAAAKADTAFCAAAQEGIAVEAMSEHIALAAMGAIHTNMAGNGAVPKKSDSFSVACDEVTAKSHITITFNNNPGNLSYWVERNAGVGFTLHLSKKTDQALPFSFLVVDPLSS